MNFFISEKYVSFGFNPCILFSVVSGSVNLKLLVFVPVVIYHPLSADVANGELRQLYHVIKKYYFMSH